MRFLHFRLVGPAIVGIALFIAAMATFPYYGVKRIDAEARRSQEMLVERNISLWISDVEFSLTAWTIWDEAIAKLDNTFDADWTDRNIGASLIGTSRTRSVAVLNSQNTIIYSRTDDTVKNGPFFVRGPTSMVQDAADLLRNIRSREHQPKKTGIPSPLATSRIEVIGDEAVLLSVSLFQPDFGTSKPKGERAPVLITAMPIGGTLQDFFGKRFLLDDAQISPLPAVAPDRARAEIAVGAGGEIEVLSWLPPTPASDVLWQSSPLILTVGLVLAAGAVAMIRITQTTAKMLVNRERQMWHAATHDFLTGLANRSLLNSEFMALAERGTFSVVCLDLDGFKAVNDAHGHAVGDELLKVVASRLRAGVRTEDKLFRLGGDEFAIMVPGLSATQAADMCRHLSSSLSGKMKLSGCEVSIGASFGISEVTVNSPGCEVALKSADAALYCAKSAGRGSVVLDANMGVDQFDSYPLKAVG
ncbi:diguanylate cyclase [Rhizobium sp. P40RR-XXII]|uniref:sensor domain-containing diguanylate cyclase n=1 Tax=Rhizobium sp. P40RR-XXII TaxID=2726739 RepID=UPI0014574D30|nr:diguanylate cyclase [Rhizobium sp. P40RR-XXII]NLS21336.1 diguanylate cyclase [Rhizobium sp. P40RR-XXII]